MKSCRKPSILHRLKGLKTRRRLCSGLFAGLTRLRFLPPFHESTISHEPVNKSMGAPC